MLSVTGIYDGQHILLTETLNEHKKFKVIVTFVEELEKDEASDIELSNFGRNKAAFDFWNDPAEDIYQDYLKKPKA